jgi:hypothetical protein
MTVHDPRPRVISSETDGNQIGRQIPGIDDVPSDRVDEVVAVITSTSHDAECMTVQVYRVL